MNQAPTRTLPGHAALAAAQTRAALSKHGASICLIPINSLLARCRARCTRFAGRVGEHGGAVGRALPGRLQRPRARGLRRQPHVGQGAARLVAKPAACMRRGARRPRLRKLQQRGRRVPGPASHEQAPQRVKLYTAAHVKFYTAACVSPVAARLVLCIVLCITSCIMQQAPSSRPYSSFSSLHRHRDGRRTGQPART